MEQPNRHSDTRNVNHVEPQEKPTNTVNPGDQIDPSDSKQEKDEQIAVEYDDALGNHVAVPTYFEVEGEDGQKEELHHVEDAEKISDVIRQARTDEDGDRTWR